MDKQELRDFLTLDKAIDDFMSDLRQRASWDKENVDDDGTVVLPCGNGVLYRLGAAREAMGKHVRLSAAIGEDIGGGRG